MVLGDAQSDALQQLGVSYFQLLDYSSKEYTATLIQVCTLVVIVWDCVTTFDGEITFFWEAERRSRWSVARILFIVNRRLPIIAFSLNVYWRINRSLDNPLCNIRALLTYIGVPMYATLEILQVLRVWSLYNRSRKVGFFLFATVALGATGAILAKALPIPKGLPLARLAPQSLSGCGRETPRGFFECVTALALETILLTMIFLKIRRNRKHGSTPLLRALLLHGAAYYFILALAFALQIFASMNNELYYALVDTNFVICVGVVACNHLMLSLKEALNRPTSMEPLTSLSRHTTGVTFAAQASNATSSDTDQLERSQSTDRDYKRRNPEWEPTF